MNTTTAKLHFLSTGDVCRRYQCPVGSIYHRVATGRIPAPAAQIGNISGWRIEDLERFDAERNAAAAAAINIAIDKANSTAIDAPTDLIDRVNALLKKEPALSWDQAISTLALDDFSANKNTANCEDDGILETAQQSANTGAA